MSKITGLPKTVESILVNGLIIALLAFGGAVKRDPLFGSVGLAWLATAFEVATLGWFFGSVWAWKEKRWPTDVNNARAIILSLIIYIGTVGAMSMVIIFQMDHMTTAHWMITAFLGLLWGFLGLYSATK